eukprot:1864150-Pleurochrysis_carterae.AAC.1
MHTETRHAAVGDVRPALSMLGFGLNTCPTRRDRATACFVIYAIKTAASQSASSSATWNERFPCVCTRLVTDAHLVVRSPFLAA